MKLKMFIALLLFLAFIPILSSDGMAHIYYDGEWKLLSEGGLLAFIDYKDGFQTTTILVSLNESRGEKAVWIFPVPATPDKTAINVIEGMDLLTSEWKKYFSRWNRPSVRGNNLREEVDETTLISFGIMGASQLYPIPIVIAIGEFLSVIRIGLPGSVAGVTRGAPASGDITVHETIEKRGLTTELITAKDGNALYTYLTDKGLDLPPSSKSILDGYVGKDYSFVVSWILNISKFSDRDLAKAGSWLNFYYPDIDYDGSKNLHVAYYDYNSNHAIYQRSLNNGRTWGDRKVLGPGANAAIAASDSGKSVYVSVRNITTNHVVLYKNTDPRKLPEAWSSGVVLSSNYTVLTAPQHPTVCAWGESNVLVVSNLNVSVRPNNNEDLYVWESSNNGTTWIETIVDGGPERVDEPSCANKGNDIHILYRKFNGTNWNLWLVNKTNGAWGLPRQITNAAGSENMTWPSLERHINDSLYYTYTRDQPGENADDIMFGNMTIKPSVADKGSGTRYSWEHHIASSNGVLYITFNDNWSCYYTRSLDNGVTWDTPKMIDKWSMCGGIYAERNNVWIAYHNDDTDPDANDAEIAISTNFGNSFYNYDIEAASIPLPGTRRANSNNTLAVSITFPADKLYFPLKPTSVYGSTNIPTRIYVAGHVNPELYPEIAYGVKVDYFVKGYLSGYIDDILDLKRSDRKYTLIKINSPSKYFIDDLWMQLGAPSHIALTNFINERRYIWVPILFALISCLASFLSGTIIFRKKQISGRKLALWGLWNFLTLLGFAIATIFLRTKKLEPNLIRQLESQGLITFDYRKILFISLFSILFLVIVSILLVVFYLLF